MKKLLLLAFNNQWLISDHRSVFSKAYSNSFIFFFGKNSAAVPLETS